MRSAHQVLKSVLLYKEKISDNRRRVYFFHIHLFASLSICGTHRGKVKNSDNTCTKLHCLTPHCCTQQYCFSQNLSPALTGSFCHPNRPQKKPGIKSLAFSISIQPYAVNFFLCSTTCASKSSPLLQITVYTLPKMFAPIRRITAFCSPNNPAAIDKAPKVLNAVCQA